MVIISAGMQKSGSGYLYNVINELLIAAGYGDAREIARKYKLKEKGVIKWHNNYIDQLYLSNTLRLWLISVKEGPFTVKTHRGINRRAKLPRKMGMIRTIYCYRDPRDAVLSAIDHGKRLSNQGKNHGFTKFIDFDQALKSMREWMDVWQQYSIEPNVLMVKYEEMMANPIETVKIMEKFLGIDTTEETREEILWKYSKDNQDANQRGLHLNKAIKHRYKTDMNQQQKAKFMAAYGEYIEAMGYETD